MSITDFRFCIKADITMIPNQAATEITVNITADISNACMAFR